MRVLWATLFLMLAITACTTTIFQKTVTVRKDASGNIVETVIVEDIQQNQKAPIAKPRYITQ